MIKSIKCKVTKINLRFISKPRAHLQTIETISTKFQKIGKILCEELRSQCTDYLYSFIESEAEK